MPFKKIKGVEGLVFEPDKSSNKEKKHPCPDCFVCGWCADSRCEVCLKGQKEGKKNLGPE